MLNTTDMSATSYNLDKTWFNILYWIFNQTISHEIFLSYHCLNVSTVHLFTLSSDSYPQKPLQTAISDHWKFPVLSTDLYFHTSFLRQMYANIVGRLNINLMILIFNVPEKNHQRFWLKTSSIQIMLVDLNENIFRLHTLCMQISLCNLWDCRLILLKYSSRHFLFYRNFVLNLCE